MLKPCLMWSKLYFGLIGLSLVVMAFFTFYAWSWLQSIGAPQTAVEGYTYHAGLSWPVLWITACIMLLIANAVLWTAARSWAMWTTLVYFAIGVIVKYFWLERAAASFRTGNGLTPESLSLGPLLAVAIIAVAAVVVFFNYFLVFKLYQKTFPAQSTDVGGNAVDTSPAVAAAPPVSDTDR